MWDLKHTFNLSQVTLIKINCKNIQQFNIKPNVKQCHINIYKEMNYHSIFFFYIYIVFIGNPFGDEASWSEY